MIPLINLKKQNAELKSHLDNAIQNVINNCSFINGDVVAEFEYNFSKYIGATYSVSCGNGTDAIEIALETLGIGEGDEVIVPAISWIATSEAVSRIGATPIFVDIEEDYLTINPELIKEKISKKTKAIIPVHLYGNPCDMEKIIEIARDNYLYVIEDCAQAHGAMIGDRKVGSFGHMATFSFFPSKNLGSFGDGGMIVTSNKKYAHKARMICNHGQTDRHKHLIEGRNSRLDTIQAAVLNVKLDKLNDWNIRRQFIADIYSKNLINNVKHQKVREDHIHVYHLYVIRTENREELRQVLNDSGITTAIHYPEILPLLDCYEDLNFSSEDFPVASNVRDTMISIPMCPSLNIDEINKICRTINYEKK
jgi:dTDP-4-amino-4,6-dideoxygalactose transaminase